VASFVEDVIDKLDSLSEKHSKTNPKKLYLRVRDLFNEGAYHNLGRHAAVFIYLNKVGFNGIWRVNKSGQFNVPFGDRPKFDYDKNNLLNCSQWLATSQIHSSSYTHVTATVGEIDGPRCTVYLDPPYDGTFDGYSTGRFDRSDQARLRWWFGTLAKAKVRVLLSNADTDYVRSMYQDFDIETVTVRRSVGASSETRKRVSELLISANL
jgi:DNA adenine methylase